MEKNEKLRVVQSSLIDTHSHCYLLNMKDDKNDWMHRLRKANVEKVLLPNIDLDSIGDMLSLCDEYPRVFYPMMGLHPCDVKENYKGTLNTIYEYLKNNPDRYCGVGEIGLDYHWDLTYKEQQMEAIRTQFEWAIEFNKPVSIHSRKANQDTIPLITDYSKRGLRGIMHCFSGSKQEAQRIIDVGFYLGLGGVLTYKNSGLQEVIKGIDLEHIVLETDSPYLAPVPFRGKRNESSYVKYIAECLAEIKGIGIKDVANLTSWNAKKVFNLDD